MYILKRFLGEEFQTFNSIIDKYNLEQNNYINLTACVSYPFQEVLDVQAMPLSCIPTEGTCENRFFPKVDSMDQIEAYAESLALQLFKCDKLTYKVNIQPNSGTQANQIVYNAILNDGDNILAIKPIDGGHISHTKLGCRNINPYYFSFDENGDVNYSNLEKMIEKVHPSLVIIGASSYTKEFDYKKIYTITSRYSIPIMADICHSVLYIMSGIHKTIFPYVDFATFTMDKLLCGPQGGVVVYKKKYDKQISSSVFPKTQGGPIQCSLFSKTMCLVKLSTTNLYKYAKQVINNTDTLITQLKMNDLTIVNNSASNHIILINLMQLGYTGLDIEKRLFQHGILCNRNQIPGEIYNAKITSGIRLGTVPITNLKYDMDDIKKLGDYIAAIILVREPQEDIFKYLINKYHKNINNANSETIPGTL